jgi:K+-transporting ATPase ATPase A chain
MPLIVLFFSAVATMTVTGRQSVFNPGSHGFTEILFTFSSIANNNGSAFSGLNGNTFFYNFWGGIVMLLGRYWIAIPTLAIAGSLAKKKIVPAGLGTLPTHSPLFILMLISVTLILGALTFFPALAIGPIIEHLLLWKNYAI